MTGGSFDVRFHVTFQFPRNLNHRGQKIRTTYRVSFASPMNERILPPVPLFRDRSHRSHVAVLYPRKSNHYENTMKTREIIFGEMLKKIFYDHVRPGLTHWRIIIRTHRDYHRVLLTLSWKYGNAVKDFSYDKLCKKILRNYKKCNRMDYYSRKYGGHVSDN